MVNMLAINAALSSVKAAKDITEAMIGLRDGAAFQEKRIELQSKLLDAQQFIFTVHDERAADIQRISTLEKEIANMRKWEAEKEKYQLETISAGGRGGEVFAYSRKEGMEPAEPPHKICANCYQNGEKSILQSEYRMPGMDHFLACSKCKSDICIAGVRRPEHSGKKSYK